jgi:uncharacterized protein YajQ (UPF0234 family)/MoaA/NifB/PqqE/SkfB family radical SAM enzyme
MSRNARATREFVRGLVDTDHPLLVHIVPVRRCNIACGYCNEYDKVSQPVPIDRLERWVDKLAELGTSVVACSGGEPLLHPQLERLIRRVRGRGMMAGLITNGYMLSEQKIDALNEAGLDFLQISIDNVEPDGVSMKSLRLLDRKLEWLSERAEFDVNINSVLGAGIRNPEDARTITRRAKELGFSTSIGIIHDGVGTLKPLGPAEREIWREVTGQVNGLRQLLKNLYSGIRGFQQNLADGRPNDWRCRAGGRYFYVCEEGLVHLCSQQRGYPAIPLERYGVEELRREFDSPKPCAPYCTIGCVHRVSTMDFWRRPQKPGKILPMPSFDVTSTGDLQEVDNAVNQARKEVSQRYDFKGSKAAIDFDRTAGTLTLTADDEFKLQALWEVLETRMVRRKVPLKNLKRGEIEHGANDTVRRLITLQQGVPTEAGREIAKFIKDRKLKKVQPAIQGDQLRISSPSRDELQTVMSLLRAEDFGVELQFGNYRE